MLRLLSRPLQNRLPTKAKGKGFLLRLLLFSNSFIIYVKWLIRIYALYFFFFLSSVGSQIAEVAQECVSDISGEGLRFGHGTLSYYCNLSVELGYGILGGVAIIQGKLLTVLHLL
jgi:hypothetical protein